MTIEKISELDWFHKYLILSDFPEYIFLHPDKENYIAMCCNEKKAERLTAAPPLSWNLLLNIPQTNIYIDTGEQMLRDRSSLRYSIDGKKVEVINIYPSFIYSKTKDIKWVLDDVTVWYCKELTKHNDRQHKIYSIIHRGEECWTKYFTDCSDEANTTFEALASEANPTDLLKFVEIDLL
jgi:hypothetical protein